jgi:PEGA domain-containing protein/PDZ domain-containing protein
MTATVSRWPLLVFALALAAPAVRAQESAAPSGALSEAVQKELAAVQDLLARATAEFEGPQQSRSIVQFDEIVTRLEVLHRQGTLPTRGREILSTAYELRARAYYNIGLQEKAADSFRSLVQLNPQYSVSKERVSPKVVDYFNSVKKALVGYLAVSSSPAGAKVSLNGEFLSLTDFFPLEVLAGEYTVEITREGYRTETRAISIAPKATETLQVDLTRTLASAFVVTEPAGVEIWLDGQLRATTSGTPGPELLETVRAKGLDPARASGRTELGNLSLGSHNLEFRRKCYETVKRQIEVPEARDYETEGIKLQDSVASLQLRSEPPGARIFLDGEAMGITPKDLDGVCSGKHHVEVKHTSGKFVQDIVVSKDESVTLDCPIRPSLAYLGVVAESAAGERFVPDVEEKLIENLQQKVTALNFVPAPRDTVDRVLESEKLTRKALLAGSGVDPDIVRKVTIKLAEALEVQGFLLALLPGEKLQRTAVLNLLAAGNTVPDTSDVTFGESASYMRFLAAVDRKATLYRPWTGLITVDTSMYEGVPVLRVVPGSPAAQAGVQAAEVLAAVDGKTVKQTSDLLAAVDAKKAKDKLGLSFKGAGGAARAVDLTLADTPQEIPLNDPSLLYNKVMIDLLAQIQGYPGTETAAFARLNLAICAMHFGDFAAAHEHLLKARTELPARPGLSQGTALYYLGLALERLGYKKEAVDAYRAAAGFKDATLFNNDGPSVAPLAARRGGN